MNTRQAKKVIGRCVEHCYPDVTLIAAIRRYRRLKRQNFHSASAAEFGAAVQWLKTNSGKLPPRLRTLVREFSRQD